MAAQVSRGVASKNASSGQTASSCDTMRLSNIPPTEITRKRFERTPSQVRYCKS